MGSELDGAIQLHSPESPSELIPATGDNGDDAGQIGMRACLVEDLHTYRRVALGVARYSFLAGSV